MKNRNYEVKQIGETRVLEIYLYGEIEGDWCDWQGNLHESTTSAKYVQNALALAKDELVKDDTLLIESDLIFSEF